MRPVSSASGTAAIATCGSGFRPMRGAFGSRPQAGRHGRLLMRFAVALILVVASWGTSSAAAAPPANGVAITSVSPNPARRSERVTVTGHGFGARNVTVRLGGQPVLPDVALGSKLEFVVPEYSPVGDLPLELVNPGGITATATLTVLFDGRVQPVVDRARTVTQSIGPAGGSITLDTTTLTIPPGALLAPEDISMSPLASLVGSPLSPVYDAVQLEPSGLRLLRPAQLSMPLRAPAADFATFLYEGSGEDMHLAPYSISGLTVSVEVSHFSGGGSGGAANAPSMYSFSPSNAQAHAEQQIAAALLMLEQGRADEALFNAMVDQALRIWFASVINGFQVALGGPIEYFEFAVGDWLAWRAQVTLLDRDAALALQVSTSQDVARGVAITHARRILATCTGRDPDPFAGVAEIIHLVGLLELEPATFDLHVVAPDLANGQDLVFQCVHIDIDLFDGPPVFARNSTHNTVKLRAQVAFANGAPRRDIPLVFEVEELRVLVGAPTLLVTELVTTGSLSRRVDISGLAGGPRASLDAHARLAAQATDTTLAVFDATRTLARDVRSRTELNHLAGGTYAADLASIQPGSPVSFRVRLAGDGMDQQPLLAFADNPQEGTLTPPSTAAGGTGEATFSYVVSVGSAAPQTCVRVDWAHAGVAEGASDCFAIGGSAPPPPPPPPPPAELDPRGTYVGTHTLCTNWLESAIGTPCFESPMTVTITGGSGLGREWFYTLTTSPGGQCFSATITATGAMQVRLKECGAHLVGDGTGTGLVTATTLAFDRLNAFPSANRSGVSRSDFVGRRVQ